MQACSGIFGNRLYGTMRVAMEAGALVAQVGELRMRLEPAQPGLFAAAGAALAPAEPLHCDAGAGQLRWNGQVFDRQATGKG